MIRLNEIFPYLACYGQKLNFFCSEIETNINISSVKGSGENEIGIIFFKKELFNPLQPVLTCDHSQIIILYTSYITQV